MFPVPPRRLDAFVVDVTGGAAARALTAELRRAGLAADRAYDDRSMKAQMKLAGRSGAVLALIVGEDEAEAGMVTVRSLRVGDKEAVHRSEVVDLVRKLADRERGAGTRA